MGLVALILCIIILFECAVLLQKKIEEVYPILLCVLILIMQALGMVRCLSYIVLVVFLLAVMLGTFIVANERKSKDFFLVIKQKIVQYGLTCGGLVIVETIILCIVLQQGRWVKTYDEYNFWATAVKSLWYNNGFATAKDMWEIWEYPQAMPLFQWFGVWILGQYEESVLYIMRLIFDVSFIIALTSKLKIKWYWTPFVSILVLIFPSVVNATSYMTLSVDGDLGLLFGYALCCIMDRKEKNVFYYTRIAILLSVIAIAKTLSIVWIAYAILFLLIVELYENIKAGCKLLDKELLKTYLYITLVAIVPLLILKSWSVFLAMTGSTSTHVSSRAASALPLLLKGQWQWSGYEKQVIESFIKSIFVRSVSYASGGTNGIITPFVAIAFFVLMLHFIVRMGKMEKKLRNVFYAYWFFVFSTYFVVFIISLYTVFVGEISKYAKLDAMALALGRYCAPAFLGSFMWITYLLLQFINDKEIDRIMRKRIAIFCLAYILIGCNISALSAICWISPTKRATAERQISKLDEKVQSQFSWAECLRNETGKKKICVLNNHTIDMAYVYKLYPIMLKRYDSIATAKIETLGELQNYLHDNGFTYIYYEESIENNMLIELCNKMLDEEAVMEIGSLYKIDMTNITFKLSKMD